MKRNLDGGDAFSAFPEPRPGSRSHDATTLWWIAMTECLYVLSFGILVLLVHT